LAASQLDRHQVILLSTTPLWIVSMGWLYFVPRFLLSDFTWPHRILGTVLVESDIPKTPEPYHRLIRLFWGYIHFYLGRFSRHYCGWVGIEYNNQIADLPFGLILKWSDGTRLEEVLTMKVARAAGFPVPKVITYGEHPAYPHAPISILMTRLPGRELGQVYEDLSDEDRATALSEMQAIFDTMRRWKSPWGDDRICSIIGGAIEVFECQIIRLVRARMKLGSTSSF
jgi:hypothetical protein